METWTKTTRPQLAPYCLTGLLVGVLSLSTAGGDGWVVVTHLMFHMTCVPLTVVRPLAAAISKLQTVDMMGLVSKQMTVSRGESKKRRL